MSICLKVILSKKDFLSSYFFEKRGKESAKILDKYGVFDKGDALRYDSQHMPLISLLGLYTHFSGTLFANSSRADGRPTQFQASLGDRKVPFSLKNSWEDQLGLHFRSQKESYRFGENGAHYARLLYLLGFSTSVDEDRNERENSKAERRARIPNFLTELQRSYDDFNISGKRIARRYLRDLIQVCFQTSASFSEGQSECLLFLHAQRSPYLVRKNAEFIFNSMKTVYPGLTSNLNGHFRPYGEQKSNRIPYYQGILSFSTEDIARISTPENSFPIKSRLFLQPRFSVE